jgi:hypothetical protein
MEFTVTRRTAQLLTALALVAIAILLALNRWWPFNTSPPGLPKDKPTFWQFLLSDHLTLGFVRLGVVMLAVFVIASVPALVTGGRWLKGFGTTGLTADDALDADKALGDAKKELDKATQELEAVKQERDDAIQFANAIVRAHEPI